MRVLVVGSGGREHALCWSLAKNNHRVWCAPGNPGTAQVATNVPIAAIDVLALAKFAAAHEINMVIPGSEASLASGITDVMNRAEIPCFGPTRQAAQLEASKAFTKIICAANNIPNAVGRAFQDQQSAESYIKKMGGPWVIKADGLAAGKGVRIAETETDAIRAVHDLMQRHTLGNAGATVVIEEKLNGPELSFFALCNGTRAVPFGAARDHKRLTAAPDAPNTGGMGAYTVAVDDLQGVVMDSIIYPTLHEMMKREQPFVGVLYAGLMLTEDGPKLIEFNVRFGDPEWQAMAMAFEADLYETFAAVLDGGLPQCRFDRVGMSVVIAAAGYPEKPARGSLVAIPKLEDVTVFHAGTEVTPGGRLIASGGRVLNVAAAGDSLMETRERIYQAIPQIEFPDGIYRQDVGEIS